MKLYKYADAEYLSEIFSYEKKVVLKCTYPKDFNDPYELFLTINFSEPPEVLAFYNDVIGELPQIPTTCFSRSPSIIPMWAHYAHNLEGFVLELEESILQKRFPESGFGDVDYRDNTNESIKETLYRAYEIGKFRYMYFLQRAVFSAAYYTKSNCWNYELERRMVVNEKETVRRDGNILVEVPYNCISAVIGGPRASDKAIRELKKNAKKIGCSYFDMKIGKSSSAPFFSDTKGIPHVFVDGILKECDAYCVTCQEPIGKNEESCSWCQIDESCREAAAARNSFRALAHAGMLKSYIKSMREIDRKYKG